MREPTKYHLESTIGAFEFERLVPEILFNLDRDPNFPGRHYLDIRKVGGTKDEGHDSISITWLCELEFEKKVYAFSKREDWDRKLKEDLEKHRRDTSVSGFVFVTTQTVGAEKLPKNLIKYKKDYGFDVEIIDIEDLILWLDNTPWGKDLKRKYGLLNEKDEAFKKCIEGMILDLDFNADLIEDYANAVGKPVSHDGRQKIVELPPWDLRLGCLEEFMRRFSMESLDLHFRVQTILVHISSVKNSLELFKQTANMREFKQFQEISRTALPLLFESLISLAKYLLEHFGTISTYEGFNERYSKIFGLVFQPFYDCNNCDFYSESSKPGFIRNLLLVPRPSGKMDLKNVRFPSQPFPDIELQETLDKCVLRVEKQRPELIDIVFKLKDQTCPSCSNIIEMKLRKMYIGS